ncbi:MAG TPA: hypothetical protein PK306_13865 [Aquabacterium sp.]|nr:hypothetical protein [Aquabacterium sp.]HQC96785.1 hypothetical protein [Aquabacterium sp.]
MIEANAELFSRLASAGGDLISADLRKQKRAIRTNEIEKSWLRQLRLRSSNHLLIDSTSRFALGDYDGKLYLITVSVNIFEPPAELQRLVVNAGMFTAIVNELRVPILRSPNLAERLLEYVFYPVEGEYELLDLEVVEPFFERVGLYLVEPTSALADDSEFGFRAAIAAILGAPDARPLEWRATALDRFGFMVRDPEERAPFHMLLRALTETRGDAAFLALYRCVEQLFPVPAIAELAAELGLAASTLGVAAAIERHLGWRRREEDALAHLFAELDGTLIDRMLPVVGAVAQNDNRSRPVSRRVYELRNQCVHFRPAHALGEALKIDDWGMLTNLMLEAVQALYARYTAAFDGPTTGSASNA